MEGSGRVMAWEPGWPEWGNVRDQATLRWMVGNPMREARHGPPSSILYEGIGRVCKVERRFRPEMLGPAAASHTHAWMTPPTPSLNRKIRDQDACLVWVLFDRGTPSTKLPQDCQSVKSFSLPE